MIVEPEYEYNNHDNIRAAESSLLTNIALLAARADRMKVVRWALDDNNNPWPLYVEVSSDVYSYSTHDLRFTLHLVDDTDNEAQWKENARKIVEARKFFDIKELKRTVVEDGTVYYSGRGRIPSYDPLNKSYDILLVVPKGGLPPTCTIEVVEEEVTRTYVNKTVKTNCAPRHQHSPSEAIE